MTRPLSERILAALACPHCSGALVGEPGGRRCRGCARTYRDTPAGQPDLRLQAAKSCRLTFELGTPFVVPADLELTELPLHPGPEVDFRGLGVPRHFDAALLSHVPRARRPGSLALDVGCGEGIHREICERAGYEYVGVDADAPRAPLLGDAHALPIRDESVDLILTIAVLEHIRYPFVAAQEMRRVLRPGGVVLGTVAFLEPFHSASFFHHTHLGLLNVLAFGGLTVQRIAPSRTWSGLTANAAMGLFPKLPKPACRALVLPLALLHRLWWKTRYLASGSARWSERHRLLVTTGAFSFLARRD